MTDGHGDDLYRYGDKVRSNFSTNICSAVDHTALLEHLAGMGERIKSYPEPTPVSVESCLAGQLDIPAEAVMVTNGATEAIYMIAQSRYGGRSQIVAPTFREYQDACRLFRHQIRFISGIDSVNSGSDLVWLCNPNNPTGNVTERDRLVECIHSHPDVLFVIDQAYADYTELPVLTAEDALTLPNVILLYSLTKLFAIPGLRIGYAVGNPATMAEVRRYRMPWSVNCFAIEAANFLIPRRADYHIDATRLHAEALRIAAEFRGMGIAVVPSDCNFILCELPKGTAAELKDYLIEKHGILIRDASNFEGLGERHFRVAAQAEAENDCLIKAVKEWIISQ
ncbi:MAG: aminotransferase class I/II-fold pyridoxal phosphate-dependent enzyme [Muribaculaceae bacterium]|nr:aminotransferase class I/II-fold pyridoxal phosphate-dependent enzyme [Muribaculaceae bacterium]